MWVSQKEVTNKWKTKARQLYTEESKERKHGEQVSNTATVCQKKYMKVSNEQHLRKKTRAEGERETSREIKGRIYEKEKTKQKE